MKITKFPTPIYVTRPLLPDRENMFRELAEIWDSQWLTNMGKKHNQLENELKTELKVHHLSLFNNGTIALLTAIKAFNFPPGSESSLHHLHLLQLHIVLSGWFYADFL